jgi:hypothetical protein
VEVPGGLQWGLFLTTPKNTASSLNTEIVDRNASVCGEVTTLNAAGYATVTIMVKYLLDKVQQIPYSGQGISSNNAILKGKLSQLRSNKQEM